MTTAEQNTSVHGIPTAANDGVFSAETNTAVNTVIGIAEARARLEKANKNVMGIGAWALDMARRVMGTEGSQAETYAEMVRYRTLSAANNSKYAATSHPEPEKKAV